MLQKSNLIRVRLQADGARRAGMTPLLLGPEAEVRAVYETTYRYFTGGAFLVIVLMVVLAALAASLWFTQLDNLPTAPTAPTFPSVQRDSLYAFAALAAGFFALRLGDRLIESSPIPWPAWGVFTAFVLSASLISFYALLIVIAKLQARPWAQLYLRWVPALMVLAILVNGLALWASWPSLQLVWYSLLWLLGLGWVLVYVRLSWLHADTIIRLMTAAMLLNVIVTGHDLWQFRVNPVLNDASLAVLGSAAYVLAMFYIVITRFRTASAQARDLRNTLEQRVHAREQELAQSYEKLELLSREQAKSEERTRILRDMHDGVGAHISAAIRQVEFEQVDIGLVSNASEGSVRLAAQAKRAELLQTLRDSLDQLKLSIDAMHLQAGDITGLLANLRYRLEPRLKSSGITLQWAVELLHEQPQFDHAALRQLQFMLFEAFSNVLQHSGATHLRLVASQHAGRMVIALQDNGKGFDTAQPSRGLASMRERARAIGAMLNIRSTAGATEVEISWTTGHNQSA
ncbi:MAG: hypothetical protein HC765_13325 [Brachymonas sp.]|nr:hypothetical protein [Brachymonas sp.]